MAEDFQAAVCGGNWWNSPRTAFNRLSCSAVVTDIDIFGTCWPSGLVDMKAKSSDESSDGSMVFQDIQKPGGGSTTTMSPDSAFQMMATTFSDSSPTATTDWNQNLLPRVQEGMTTFSTGDGGSTAVTAAEHQGFSMDQEEALNFITSSGDCTTVAVSSSTSYGYPSSLLQSLFDSNSPPPPPQQPFYDFQSGSNDFSYVQSLPSAMRPKQQVPGDLHLANNTRFWNASASPLGDNISSFFRSPPSQFPPSKYERKQSPPNLTIKPNHQEIQDPTSAAKKSSGEPPFKRPRLETPSPLPTFKVRKEKLGDRITALQQLVSPFGKTDTASVLHEAIEYIKHLHDQVNILSTPYMKNGAAMQLQQSHDQVKDVEGHDHDLRSLGLCLVPVSSTFPVATETTPGFWTPSFGGSFT